MNKSFENDSRVNLFLPNSKITFNTEPDGTSIDYNIYDILGVGGSGITYDVADPNIPSKHYALKEFLPEKYSGNFVRIGSTLCVNESLGTVWNNLVDTFLKETEIQKVKDFPQNNGEFGKYFLYPVKFFKANNTAYILYDTEACMTLKDKITELRTEDNSKSTLTLETVLQYFIDVCTAVDILHSLDDAVFHLDISDNNIMVTPEGNAKLTDFGSAIRKSAVDQNRKEVLTYSNEFSPIEQKVASSNGDLVAINEKTDIYAVCAVLYKCIFGKVFNPITSHINYSKAHKLYYLPPKTALTKEPQAIWRILDILKKGLCGNEYRYKSVSELKNELKKLKSNLENNRDSLKFGKRFLVYSGCIVIILALSFVFAFYFIPSTPTVSANIDSVYAKGDDITFSLFLTDKNGISNDITSESFFKNIEIIGFDVENRDFKLIKKDDYVIELMITLGNITSNKYGKKQININDIYQCNKMDTILNLEKTNKHETYEFELVEQNIECVISGPSVTKVNSNRGHNVTYRVFFKSPVECDIDISAIKRVGFNCESCESKYLGNNTFEITLKNISGSTGTGKYIYIYSRSAIAKNGKLYSKGTEAPHFEIVDEEVSNRIITFQTDTVFQNLKNDGSILLEYSCSSLTGPYEMSSKLISKIQTYGFTAQLSLHNKYLLFSNLNISDFNNMQIHFDDGCCKSLGNGSVSSEFTHFINKDEFEYLNNIDPVASITIIGSRQIKSGNDLFVKVNGADHLTNWCLINRTNNLFEASGFTYSQCDIFVEGLEIFAIYKEVQPISGVKPSVLFKEGVFSNKYGKTSSEINIDFEIIK